MQKRATQYLRLPGERIMKLAEELYQAGYVSYPRTETDVFDPGMDLRVRVTPSWAGQRGLVGICFHNTYDCRV